MYNISIKASNMDEGLLFFHAAEVNSVSHTETRGHRGSCLKGQLPSSLKPAFKHLQEILA